MCNILVLHCFVLYPKYAAMECPWCYIHAVVFFCRNVCLSFYGTFYKFHWNWIGCISFLVSHQARRANNNNEFKLTGNEFGNLPQVVYHTFVTVANFSAMHLNAPRLLSKVDVVTALIRFSESYSESESALSSTGK